MFGSRIRTLVEFDELIKRAGFERTSIFEAPANDPQAQFQMFGLIQQFGLNPSGSPLSTQISPQAREALGGFARETGMPAEGLEPLRPWLAAVTLTAGYVQSQGFEPESGVEAQLWPLAEQQGKTIDYFEGLLSAGGKVTAHPRFARTARQQKTSG